MFRNGGCGTRRSRLVLANYCGRPLLLPASIRPQHRDSNPNQITVALCCIRVHRTLCVALPNTLGTTPISLIVYRLRTFLHPLPESDGKLVLFGDWMGWFDNVANMGFALLASSVVYFAFAIYDRGGSRWTDDVVSNR